MEKFLEIWEKISKSYKNIHSCVFCRLQDYWENIDYEYELSAECKIQGSHPPTEPIVGTLLI